MKLGIKIAAIILLSVFGVVSVSLGADVAKIGVVNFQRILDESSGGKIITKKIGDRSKEIRQRLINERNAINKMTQDFSHQTAVMTLEQQDEKAREIRIRRNDAVKMEKRLAQGFKKLQAELLAQFHKDVTQIVTEIGKKEGYLLILAKKESAVVFSPDNIDITDAVIKQYNKLTAKKK